MAGRSRTETVSLYAGAFFLFGLAALFMTGTIFPGILILVWLTSVPFLLAEKGWLGAWITAQMTLWLVALPALFFTGFLVHGVLFLSGVSVLLVAVAPPEKLEARNQQKKAKRKLKREMPLPYVEDEENMDYWQVEEERRQRSSQ